MKKALLPCLVLLAVAQIALLVVGTWVGTTPDGAPRVGDRVSDIVTTGPSGSSVALAAGEPTLVLVFHSACAHCRTVAPLWQSWLSDHRDAVAVVALAAETHESAVRFAIDHEWGVEVRAIPEVGRGTREHWLTSRTPWLFALDEDGQIVAEGHGTLIEEIGGVVIDRRPKSIDE